MAPRPLEKRADFITRLKKSAEQGATEVRFGGHHFTHAVCREGEVWRLRLLETTAEERDAYLAERGFFMPESQEEIAKPRTLRFEAPSLDKLIARIKKMPWPGA